MSNNPATATVLIDLLQRGALSQVAYVAAELQIADYLADAPMHISDLAGATGAHEQSLHRLMRALVSLGLCIEHEDERYALSPAGMLMRSNTDDSLHAWLLWYGRHQWSVWGQLLQSVMTGESVRKRSTEHGGFELFERDPDLALLFNRTMVQQTRLIAADVARTCDFSGIKTILDVGGGHGAILEVLLKTNAELGGVLLDRPHAIESARAFLQQAGIVDRCELVAGDFFASIPAGADLYVLKNIIHDWDDQRATQILRNCCTSMSDRAILLLIERLLPARLEACSSHRAVAHADLTMLLGVGGQERTEGEFRTLLQASELQLNCVRPVALGYSILECTVSR